MGYNRGDSFPFDFEPNVIPFGSISKGNVKGNGKRVFSVYLTPAFVQLTRTVSSRRKFADLPALCRIYLTREIIFAILCLIYK